MAGDGGLIHTALAPQILPSVQIGPVENLRGVLVGICTASRRVGDLRHRSLDNSLGKFAVTILYDQLYIHVYMYKVNIPY